MTMLVMLTSDKLVYTENNLYTGDTPLLHRRYFSFFIVGAKTFTGHLQSLPGHNHGPPFLGGMREKYLLCLLLRFLCQLGSTATSTVIYPPPLICLPQLFSFHILFYLTTFFLVFHSFLKFIL